MFVDKERWKNRMYDVKKGYEAAKEFYAQYGIDVEKAIEIVNATPISMHCWQGDDVAGCEKKEDSALTGGIQATGNYPGKARNGEELRADVETAMKFINMTSRIMGEYGYTKRSPMERFLRDVKVMEIYEGTSEIQRLIISKQLLK